MRQFIAKNFPAENGRLLLTDEDAKYLHSVLRLTQGAKIFVRLPDESLLSMELRKDTNGWFFESASDEVAHNSAGEFTERGIAHSATIFAPRETRVFDSTDCVLIQFLPKPNRMDTIVRQMAECGARFIAPVAGAYSPRTDASKRDERRKKIIREARQQSASPVRTELLETATPSQACDWWNSLCGKEKGLGILLHETQGSESLDACLEKFVARENSLPRFSAIVVGTEGGMNDEERELFLCAGFLQVHFATNILRVDTAALYGMASLQTALAARAGLS